MLAREGEPSLGGCQALGCSLHQLITLRLPFGRLPAPRSQPKLAGIAARHQLIECLEEIVVGQRLFAVLEFFRGLGHSVIVAWIARPARRVAPENELGNCRALRPWGVRHYRGVACVLRLL